MSKISLGLTWNGVKIDESDFERRNIGVFSVVFKDKRNNSADELDFQLNDPYNVWKDENIPRENDRIKWEIKTARHVLITPDFYIDGLEWIEPQSTVRVKCLNYQYLKGHPMHTGRVVDYGDTTLRNIVGAIAQRNKLELLWFGNDRQLEKLKQYKRSDFSFLSKLAYETGSFFKFMGKKLVWGSDADGYTFTRNGGEVSTSEEGAGQRYIEIPVEDMSKITFSLKGDKKTKIAFEPFKALNSRLDRVFGSKSSDFELGPVATDGLITKPEIAIEGILTKLVKGKLTASIKIPVTDTMGPLAQELLAGSLVYLPEDFRLLGGTYVIEEATHTISTQTGWIIDLNVSRLSSESLPKSKRNRKQNRKAPEKTTPKEPEKKNYCEVNEEGLTPLEVSFQKSDQVTKERIALSNGEGLSGDDFSDDGESRYDYKDIGPLF